MNKTTSTKPDKLIKLLGGLYSPCASLKKICLFSFRSEWWSVFDFVKHVIREFEMGDSTQIRVVCKILQNFS